MPIKSAEQPPQITFSAFHKASILDGYLDRFDTILADINNHDALKAEDWLGLALFSNIINGALLDSKMIVTFTNRLITKELTLETYKPVVWIELIREIGAGLNNLKIENTDPENEKAFDYFHARRHFFDSLSLALTQRYQSCETDDEDKADLTEKDILSLLHRTIFKDDETCQRFLKLKDLCSAGKWHLQNDPDVAISPALLEMASHGTPSFSTDSKSWHNLYTQPKSCRYIPSKSLTRKKKSKQASSILFKLVTPDHTILDELNAVITPPKGNRQKLTSPKIKKKLLAILEDNVLSLNVELLINYWVDLCGTNNTRSGKKTKLKPRSIRRYHCLLSEKWLLHTSDLDLEDLTPEDFLGIYSKMLSTEGGKMPGDDRSVLFHEIKRFQSLNRLNSDLDLPDTEDLYSLSGVTGIKRKYVKAKLISHQHYQATLHEIDKLPYSPRDRMALQIIVSLAFKATVRIGEALKLENRDYNKGWFHIRNNITDDNKSDAASRCIPYYDLCSKNERNTFDAFLQNPDRLKNPTAPIFDYGFGLTWDTAQVSRLISNILKEVTGDPEVSYHSLRKSAASYLHAVIEEEWEVAGLISGFEPEKLEDIRRTIVGADSKQLNKYTALSTIVGHSFSKETLKSYVLLWDLVLYQKLQKRETGVSKDVLASITDIKSRNINISDKDKLHRQLIRSNPSLYKVHGNWKAPTANIPPPTSSLDKHVDPTELLKILDYLEMGNSPKQTAMLRNVDLVKVLAYFHTAKRLQVWLNSNGKSPLFSTDRIKRFENNPEQMFLLKPALLRSKIEKTQFIACRNLLLKKIKAKDETRIDIGDIINWCLDIFSGCNSSHSYLTYQSPKKISDIIKFLRPTVKTSQWRLHIPVKEDTNPEPILRIWRMAMKEQGIKKIEIHERFKKDVGPIDDTDMGSAYLSMAHPNEAEIIKKSKQKADKYTTNLPTVLAHTLMIMIATDSDLDRLGCDV